MKKSILIGKLLLLSLAVTAFSGCSSSDDDSFDITSSKFYVIQDGDLGSSRFIPYAGIRTSRTLSGVTVTNTTSTISLEGEIVALHNYETEVSNNNKYTLGNTNGNYTVRAVAENGDAVAINHSFHKDVSELLGPMAVESFEFSVPTLGSGENYLEKDRFYAVLSGKVDNATEYGLIIIPEGQEEDYYRIDAYRYPIEIKSTGDSKWALEAKTAVNEVVNRGSGSVDSWKIAVYATDGSGLYKESAFRTLRKGISSFD